MMTGRGLQGLELTLWATWLGALWFMVLLVAPGLFKWLPRPEAGLVAGRLFYMLALYSLVIGVVLLAVSNLGMDLKLSLVVNALMVIVVAISLLELTWIQPCMGKLRAVMATLEGSELTAVRRKFDCFHVLSSVLYSIKMMVALVWGLNRYRVNDSVAV